jgi:hypothetical protein
MNNLQVTVDGQIHLGTWVAISTEAIEVCCAFGQRSVYLDHRAPVEAALEALTGMVPANQG